MSAIHLNLFKNREYDHLKKCTGTFFSIFSHAVDYADDL